jgi:hypothetical protein
VHSLLKDEQKDYSHLSDFLKNQIYRGTTEKVRSKKQKNLEEGDTYSVISKKNRYSNALIEKASREMKERRDQQSKQSVVSETRPTPSSAK